jgi:hypothetical protein
MSTADHRVYESRLRRMAQRRGLQLTKSICHGRRTGGRADYYLVRAEEQDDGTRGKTLLTSEYGVDLLEVHRVLLDEPIPTTS